VNDKTEACSCKPDNQNEMSYLMVRYSDLLEHTTYTWQATNYLVPLTYLGIGITLPTQFFIHPDQFIPVAKISGVVPSLLHETYAFFSEILRFTEEKKKLTAVT
jgi:hypothetical protein